jgi:hypothetical protein
MMASRSIPDWSSDPRFDKLVVQRNLDLVKDIPEITQKFVGQPSDSPLPLTEIYEKTVTTVISDPMRFMIAVSIAWHGKWLSPAIAYKNFIHQLKHVDDKRLRKEELYNQILFEYIFLLIGKMFRAIKKEDPPSAVKALIQHSKVTGDSIGVCWQKLNKEAGLFVEDRNLSQWKTDAFFQNWWDQIK